MNRPGNSDDSVVHNGADHAWLWCGRPLPPKDPLGKRQGEEFTLGALLRVVRAGARAQLRVTHIEIASHGGAAISTKIKRLGVE